MSKNGYKHKNYLESKFGTRVNFNRTERKLYSHDIATVPPLVKPFIGSTMPDAVVQPETEQELIDLVKWAGENNVFLTPRGKATSGYGGVLPVKKGLVVDFHRMDRVLKIDDEAKTVTVQPGVIWERLDKKIKKHSLTLKLYPSSYPGSTVGGWLAHGGSGIGSYEAGEFKKNVISARVVLPGGTVKEFSGPDLDMISDVEGITGLISEVTLEVMPLEDMKLLSVAIKDPHKLQEFSEGIVRESIPIWSLLFINPKMAELKNKSPLRQHEGHDAEEKVELPVAYIVTLTFREKDEKDVMDKLGTLIKNIDGEVLSEKISEHEWAKRFNLMVVKRLGPSLVPAEVIVPLDNLGDALYEIEHKIRQPLVKEGVVIREGVNGKPEVVLLGFIPSDQRKFGYNFVFALSLSIMKIAEKYGGRPYATGIYFAGKAAKILGAERLDKLLKFKKEVDPKGIMNPHKVIHSNSVGKLMSLANLMEPLIRPFGNKIVSTVGENPKKDIKGIPADVVWYAYACSQCGYCVTECDQFYGRGWESQSPRGRWYWLREYHRRKGKMGSVHGGCFSCMYDL